MAYRADVLRPFDERLWGSGAEVCNDLEASLSVCARGWRVVFDPAVAVHHYPAPRHDDDARDAPSRKAMSAAAHNELYVLVRHLPAWRGATAAAYALLVGSSAAPGLLLAVAHTVGSPRLRRWGWRLVASLACARVRAVADGWLARRSA
jgi:hypothetical protein